MTIQFGAGPVRCHGCGSLMRPSPSRPEVWPAAAVLYGRGGLCVECVEPTASAEVSRPAAEPQGAGERAGAGTTGAVADPAPRPRRRPRRRFDYRPGPLVVCPACSRPVMDGVCCCNNKP